MGLQTFPKSAPLFDVLNSERVFFPFLLFIFFSILFLSSQSMVLHDRFLFSFLPLPDFLRGWVFITLGNNTWKLILALFSCIHKTLCYLKGGLSNNQRWTRSLHTLVINLYITKTNCENFKHYMLDSKLVSTLNL